MTLLCMTALIPAVTHGMRGTAEGGFSAYLLTMGVCGLLNSAVWVYAAARSGLRLAEVAPVDRWLRALSSLGLPLVSLPALVAPPEGTLLAVIGGAVVATLLRRVVLPRIFGRAGSPNRSEAS